MKRAVVGRVRNRGARSRRDFMLARWGSRECVRWMMLWVVGGYVVLEQSKKAIFSWGRR